MNRVSPQSEAEQEYDRKHGHPLGATLIIVVCVFTIGLLLFCSVRYRTSFFGFVGLGLMTIGTGLETGRVYVVLRTPRCATFRRAVVFFVVIVTGEITYIITSSVRHYWNSVAISTIAVQSLHLCLSALAIAHLRRLPEFDPNQRAEPAAEPTCCDMSLVPEAEAIILESNSSESQEKKTVTGFVFPYEEGGIQSDSPYETSDAMAVGNLPAREAIAFPGHVIAESKEA
jgi:hypothetical protein